MPTIWSSNGSFKMKITRSSNKYSVVEQLQTWIYRMIVFWAVMGMISKKKGHHALHRRKMRPGQHTNASLFVAYRAFRWSHGYPGIKKKVCGPHKILSGATSSPPLIYRGYCNQVNKSFFWCIERINLFFIIFNDSVFEQVGFRTAFWNELCSRTEV